MNELNKLYKAMWESWNGGIEADAKMFISIGGTKIPVSIDEMSIYMPYSEVLDGNVMNKIFFHPACENIVSKETEIFKVIRKASVMRLLTDFRNYPLVLIGVAKTGTTKRSWKQNILDILEPLQDIKRPVQEEINKLFGRLETTIGDTGLDNRFIHFKVTKGGGRSSVTGSKVFYRTKPTFPFYNEMVKRLARSEGQPDNHTVEINGFSVSRKALKIAVHLFQVIVPAVNNPDDYEVEATSPTAARMTSYLGSYCAVADDMNSLQNCFRAEFDKAGIYPINTEWVELLENLDEWYRQVPVMEYNSHDTKDESSRDSNFNDMFRTTSNRSQEQAQLPPQQNNMPQDPDYDTTVPQMQPGDRYIRTEIDYVNRRVLHYAQNQATGEQAVYRCSRYGNFLQRDGISPMMNQVQQPNMMMMNPMMMAPQMMMNPHMMMMYGQQQMPTVGTAMSTVIPDNTFNELNNTW